MIASDGAEKTVDVAIATYRSAGEICECLSSVSASRGVEVGTVAVVDNASDDGTADLIESQFPTASLTRADSNLGFSAAINRAARSGGSEYLLVLNPDVILDPDVLQSLASVLGAHPEIGIAGCRLVLPEGGEDHAARRSFPTPAAALAHFTGLSRLPGAKPWMKSYLAPEAASGGRVDAVNGALMLVRRADFERAGGFDERYWMYMEDLDLCWRFARMGLGTWYEPSVKASHVKGASSGSYRNFRLNWAFHRGMLRFYRDHLASSHNPAYNLVIYLGVVVKLIVSVIRSAAGRLAGGARRQSG